MSYQTRMAVRDLTNRLDELSLYADDLAVKNPDSPMLRELQKRIDSVLAFSEQAMHEL